VTDTPTDWRGIARCVIIGLGVAVMVVGLYGIAADISHGKVPPIGPIGP
jgi:hypothetical protein